MKTFFRMISFATLLLSLGAFAQTNEANILKAEYEKLDKLVSKLTPDGQIGGIMNFKKMDNYEILWDLGITPEDYSVIRIFNEHSDGTANFMVSYFLSPDIVEGRTVIRRFVGPLLKGWRNDTIDVESEKYYGYQGDAVPVIDKSDAKLIKKLGITLFE